jgi:HCOMODA/2-hydroxy-3-carboxy-muconic semialdehyde decarboxylase
MRASLAGGEVNYLTPREGEKADKTNFIVLDRIWNLWKMRILPQLGK